MVAGCDHPNFWKFVTIIQNEQDGVHRSLQQIVAGEKPPIRRKAYISLNKRLLSLVMKYSKGSYELMDYIHGIAHNLTIDTRRWKLTMDQVEDPKINDTGSPQRKKAKMTEN